MLQTFYSCEKSISEECGTDLILFYIVTTFYYPVSTLLSVKWSLTGGEKQKRISNF